MFVILIAYLIKDNLGSDLETAPPPIYLQLDSNRSRLPT